MNSLGEKPEFISKEISKGYFSPILAGKFRKEMRLLEEKSTGMVDLE